VTDWANLPDACGSAEHVPAVLDRFEADPGGRGRWEELMEHLCPPLMDGAYPASFAALPRLAALAERLEPRLRGWPISAAGAITACAIAPPGPDDVDVFSLYADAIASLHRLTEEQLPLIRDPGDYTWRLRDLLSFEAVVLWDRLLEDFSDREYSFECPACWVDVFVLIGEGKNWSASENYWEHEVEQVPLRPARPEELTGLARRVYERVLADDQPTLVAGVLHLSGQAVCPDCRHAFPIADEPSTGWMS
jgi:hypothetical protein